MFVHVILAQCFCSPSTLLPQLLSRSFGTAARLLMSFSFHLSSLSLALCLF